MDRRRKDLARETKLKQKRDEGELNQRGATPDSNPRRSGPDPERLKIEEPMDVAIQRMFQKGKPPKRDS